MNLPRSGMPCQSDAVEDTTEDEGSTPTFREMVDQGIICAECGMLLPINTDYVPSLCDGCEQEVKKY